MLWLPLIGVLAYLAVAVSPSAEGLEGAERLAAEVPRQVANAATIWAVANVVIFLPFAGLFARFVQRLIPERAEAATVIVRPKYLDEEILEVPSIALERMQLELGHMAQWVGKMLADLKPAFERADPERYNEIVRDGDRVALLRDHILDFARRLGQGELTEHEAARYAGHLAVAADIESVADVSRAGP